MESKMHLAISYFHNKANCAQSILLTYGPAEGLTPEQCLRLGSGMGGGIGYKQNICGAINAGALIISLREGNQVMDDAEKKDRATSLVGEYVEKCTHRLGSTNCQQILGIDLNDPIQKQKARDAGLFDMVCGNAIKVVCELLENDYRANNR